MDSSSGRNFAGTRAGFPSLNCCNVPSNFYQVPEAGSPADRGRSA